MGNREGTDAGQIVGNITLENVLGAFNEIRGPVITTSEVADKLDCTTEVARQKLTRLYNRDKLDKRTAGGTVVWWYTDDTPQTPDEGTTETTTFETTGEVKGSLETSLDEGEPPETTGEVRGSVETSLDDGKPVKALDAKEVPIDDESTDDTSEIGNVGTHVTTKTDDISIDDMFKMNDMSTDDTSEIGNVGTHVTTKTDGVSTDDMLKMDDVSTDDMLETDDVSTDTAPTDTIQAAVAELDLQGSGAVLEARKDALVDILQTLKEREGATAEELKSLVDAEAVQYNDTDAFWTDLQEQDVFKELPVETPGRGGITYYYTGDI